MWYKVKRIMMWQNWVEKQVRPYKYEYSYDFRNKTTTQLANDWFLNVSWLTTGSSGITATNWTAVQCQISWLATAMSKAKKLTLELKTYITNTSAITSWLLLVKDTNNSNNIWFYYDQTYFAITANSSEIYKPSHTKSTGDKTITCVFDFVNKTYSWNYVWGNGAFSWTLTDAQISAVRNNWYIYMPVQWTSYIQTINVLVE